MQNKVNKDYDSPKNIIEFVLKGVSDDPMIINTLLGIYFVKYIQETIGVLSLQGYFQKEDFLQLIYYLASQEKKISKDKRVEFRKQLVQINSLVLSKVITEYSQNLNEEQKKKVDNNVNEVLSNLDN